jgi:capsular exopolysaccharide synthesis family protein
VKTEADHLDLERVLVVLRRRWWVILLFAVVVPAAAYGFSKRQTKEYTATTSVLFQDPQLNEEASGLQLAGSSPSAYPTVMATNVQLLTEQAGVAAATARQAGHGLTPGAVRNAISVSQQGQTNVALVSATSPKPQLAAEIANNYVTNFISIQAARQKAQVAQALTLVEHQIAALSGQQRAGVNGQALLDRAESLRVLGRLQNGGAQIVSAANVPTAPSSPKVTRNMVLGLLIGLLLGLSAAFLLERFDRRMKTIEDLEETYRLPLLAAVPFNKSLSKTYAERQVLGTHHGEHEVFRMLRAYLRYFDVDRKIRSVLVSSAAPGDGKTTVARYLAEAAQETGTKTLLIDADLRRPDIASYYGLKQAPGLSELLSGHVEVREAIRHVPFATRVNGSTSEVTLDVLVAGICPPNPAGLIDSNAMSEVLAWATEHYDLVVIDTPPLSVVSDAIPLLPKVDGVLVVSALGKTTRDAAAFLRDRMGGVNARLLGVVANGVKGKGKQDYGYVYGYYGQDEGSAIALRREDEPQSVG